MDTTGFKDPSSDYIKLEKKGDKFIGSFIKTVVVDMPKTGKTKQHHFTLKEAEVHGHDLEAGKRYTFLDHFTITDDMEDLKPGQLFYIEFQGKVKSKNGNEYNKFAMKFGDMDPNHVGDSLDSIM